MTSRFNAVPLDLSRLPPPDVIRDVSYEAILSERSDRLIGLFQDAGLAYGVSGLETDPAMVLQQTDAYRETLTKGHINDALRSVLIAFATGADLDHRAAGYGVTRNEGESDASLRRRTLFAPEAYGAAGPIGAYVFHALSAHVDVRNADVWSPEPGHVEIAVQSRHGDGSSDETLLNAVRARVLRDDIKGLTDAVSIRSVDVSMYTIGVRAQIRPGPSPEAVRTAVEASLEAMAALRNTPARDVPLSAIYAAAQLDTVERVVILSPTNDVATGRGEVALCGAIAVEVEVLDV